MPQRAGNASASFAGRLRSVARAAVADMLASRLVRIAIGITLLALGLWIYAALTR